MANLNDLEKIMNKYGRKIEANSNKETIQLAGLISETVITSTPVDTGRARGNWFATVGLPKTKPDDNALDPTGQATINKNKSEITKRLPLQPIYISNNLPYIKRLNEGYSAQAPAGFVEIAIRTARKAVKNIRLLK